MGSSVKNAYLVEHKSSQELNDKHQSQTRTIHYDCNTQSQRAGQC